MVDENGQVFVQSSTQHPTETQEIAAHVLGAAEQPGHRAGACGWAADLAGRRPRGNAFAAVVALAAVKTGRPVRLQLESRCRDMTLTGKRHPFSGEILQLGYDRDGRLLRPPSAARNSDGGWSLDLSELRSTTVRSSTSTTRSYVPGKRVQVSGRVAKTNVTSHTAFRGFGGPQGMMVIEEIMGSGRRAV